MRSSSGPLRVALVALVTLLALGALLVRAGGDAQPGQPVAAAPAPPAPAEPVDEPAPAPTEPATDTVTDPYATDRGAVQVAIRFKRPPRSGLLFDLRTGRVLWARGERRRQPIASLAKMMTALIVVDRARPDEQVHISRQALATDGSKVGLLPPGRDVKLETLLYGLMLASGNDAAVALAEHVAGSVPGFVTEMNAQAERLGLTCTRFSSPDGLEDRNNTSCVRDLAVLAREVVARPRLARIVRSEQAALPALIPHTVKRGRRERTVWRWGRLHLYTHNPLLRHGYRGTTGVKTGYTDAAGRCLVATAHRGRTSLGVVLLHSPDPGGQAMRLLDRGFRAVARARRIGPGAAQPGIE